MSSNLFDEGVEMATKTNKPKKAKPDLSPEEKSVTINGLFSVRTARITTIGVVVAAFFGLLGILLPKFWFPDSSPPASAKLENIHSLPCPVSPIGYVVVHTKSKDYCFTGVGSMDYTVNDVTSIDTGSNIASWRYEANGQGIRTPSNTDLKLHVCSVHSISYPTPVQLKKMFIADPSAKAKCTDKVS